MGCHIPVSIIQFQRINDMSLKRLMDVSKRRFYDIRSRVHCDVSFRFQIDVTATLQQGCKTAVLRHVILELVMHNMHRFDSY